jgi:uncharacterized membrane protein
MRLEYLPFVCLALMMLASAATYAFLPATMAIHWDLMLRPDNYVAKPIAVMILPIIALLIVTMQLIGRTIAHDGSLEVQFSHVVLFAVPVLLAAHLVVIGAGLLTGTRG